MLTFARIDERLIHGQVATSWLPAKKPTILLVVDDEVAKDSMQCLITKSVAPPGLKTEVLTVEKAIPIAKKYIEDSKVKLFLLFKGPEAVVKLQDGGIKFDSINLGNIYNKSGRKAFHKTTYLSDQEKDAFRKIIENGTNVYHQVYPNDPLFDIKPLLI